MIKQVTTVHRKKYVTGLFWQPVNPGVTPYIYARQLIAKTNQKYTLLTEFRSMIGLTDARNGAHAGMPSLAAEVVNALSGFISFLGVFQTDSKNYYLIAVRNGIILRDVLIETEAAARKEYAELSNMPDWNGLFAPASWGMPRSQEKYLNEIIRKSSALAKLRQVSIVKSVAPSALLILLFLFFGFLFWYTSLRVVHKTPSVEKLNPELIAEYQRQIQKKNEELDKKFEIKKKVKVYPYDNLPDVMERANLCYKAAAFVMQPVAGWSQQSVKCDEKYVSVRFIRGFGTLNDFYQIGSELMPGGVVTQTSDNDISVRVKLPELKTRSSVDNRDQDTAIRDLFSVFQEMNMRATIRPANITMKDGGQKEIVKIIDVSANSKLIPSEFMSIFGNFNGVYMKSVGWNPNNRNWEYKVSIYTK